MPLQKWEKVQEVSRKISLSFDKGEEILLRRFGVVGIDLLDSLVYFSGLCSVSCAREAIGQKPQKIDVTCVL